MTEQKINGLKKPHKLDKATVKKRILPTILISIVAPFMILLCVPFDIYGNNIDEFVFAISNFLPMLLLFALLFTAVIFFALLFLPNMAYRIASAIVVALTFMFYLQSTYLNAGLSSLAGDNMGVEEITKSTEVWNLVLWIAVVAVAVVLAILKDKKGIISTIAVIASVVIVSTQFMTVLSLSLTNKNLFLSRKERISLKYGGAEHEIATTEHLMDISTSNNIYYFVVDRFDEEYAESAIEDYSDIYDELEGFTWFKDHIAMFGHTYPAVAHMLTNVEFDSEYTREEYLNLAYKNNKTLLELKEKGYQINIHSQTYYSYTDASQLPEYVENAKKSENFKVLKPFDLAYGLVLMSLYRGFPLMAKDSVGYIDSDTCNDYVKESDKNGNQEYSSDMKELYNYVINNNFKKTDEKMFNFIHLDGCHDIKYDENWDWIPNDDDYKISLSVRNSFEIINLYLKAMKDAGVYDDATIIITGDHSHPVNDNAPVLNPRLTALFVKPSGSSEDALKTSMAQTSHDDIWATIMKSENIENNLNLGRSVLEIPEGVDRERRYIWQTFWNNFTQYTYKISGEGRNFDNWEIVDQIRYEDRYVTD